MSDSQPAPGLMQALAPIVTRRPVHIIVSPGGTDDTIHLVIQPLRVDDTEDEEIGRGFSVEASPQELDADLPRTIAEFWTPARGGLQSVLDQVRAAADKTRGTTVAKAKEGKAGGKKGTAVPGDGQTSLLAPAAAAPRPVATAPEGAAVRRTGNYAATADGDASDTAAAAEGTDTATATHNVDVNVNTPSSATGDHPEQLDPPTASNVATTNATPAASDSATRDTAPTNAGRSTDPVSDLFD